MKKILAMSLVLALCLCLCACGGAQQDFGTRMQTAQNAMEELKSVRMESTVDVSMEMSVMGQSQAMDMSVSYIMDVDKESGVVRMEMTVSSMGSSQKVLTYVETVNGESTAYLSTDNGQTWQKQTGDQSTTPNDPAMLMELFSKNTKNFKPTGTETINGAKATVYSGELDENYVGELMKMTGLGDSLGSSLGVAAGDDLFKDLGNIPMTVSIDDNTGMLLRYTMDLTKVMQKLMENLFNKLMESYGMGGIEIKINVTKAEGVTTFSKFNEVGGITVPDAAKAA